MFDIQVDHTEVVQPANTISFQVGLNAMKLACRVEPGPLFAAGNATKYLHLSN